jgi:hypothetical protein
MVHQARGIDNRSAKSLPDRSLKVAMYNKEF